MHRTSVAGRLGVMGVSALIGLGAAAHARAAARPDESATARLEARLDVLEHQVVLLQDQDAIKNLTRAYGYYVDKQLWNQVVDLFSRHCRIEIAGRGVYLGRKGARRFFQGALGNGRIGLRPGMLFNHMILQGVVHVNPDGRTARGRWRAFMEIARYHRFAIWGEGTYENRYVKRGGVWKIRDMHFYATFYTPYSAGPARVALPNNGPSKAYPPDLPPSVRYDVFPGHYVPPFDYPNPVTGQPWTLQQTQKYSTRGDNPPPFHPPAAPAVRKRR